MSERIGAVLRGACMVTFTVICVLMVIGVANRFVPLGSFGWSDEIVELMQVWTVFLGSTEVWRRGLHFRVEVLPDALQGTRAGRVLDLFVLTCSLVFLLCFTWQGYTLTRAAINVSPIFAWSRRWWYAPMPLSGLLMSLFTVQSLLAALLAPWPTRSRHESRHAV